MYTLSALALAAGIVAPTIAYSVTPPTAAAPGDSCEGIKWNSNFLKEYPTAPGACRDIKEKDGVNFATFKGKVSNVDPHFVQVTVSDSYNNPLSTIAFQIWTGGRVTIGDEVEDVKALRLGDQLTFWVREGVYGTSPNLTDRPMPMVEPEAMPDN